MSSAAVREGAEHERAGLELGSVSAPCGAASSPDDIVAAPEWALPVAWDALSRCTNGERSGRWVELFRGSSSLFVHMPRTGGTSLESALFGQTNESQHHSLPQLEALCCDGSTDGGFFRLTVVRNPLDRFLSAFAYLLGRIEKPGGPAISRHDTLAGEMLRDGPWRDSPLAFLRHLGELPSWEDAPLHFRPQMWFLGGSEGLRRMDFVGNFETVHADYAGLLRAHDFGPAPPADSMPHMRASAVGQGEGHKKSTGGGHATAELEALARRVYVEDYDAFGY